MSCSRREIRTPDRTFRYTVINSHPAYQLAYPGMIRSNCQGTKKRSFLSGGGRNRTYTAKKRLVYSQVSSPPAQHPQKSSGSEDLTSEPEQNGTSVLDRSLDWRLILHTIICINRCLTPFLALTFCEFCLIACHRIFQRKAGGMSANHLIILYCRRMVVYTTKSLKFSMVHPQNLLQPSKSCQDIHSRTLGEVLRLRARVSGPRHMRSSISCIQHILSQITQAALDECQIFVS